MTPQSSRSGEQCVMIHGLGKAITPAVEIALLLQEKMKQHVTLDIKTETVMLMDELLVGEGHVLALYTAC